MSKLIHYAKASVVWLCQLLVQVAGVLSGLVVVPIALLFTRIDPSTAKQVDLPSGKKVVWYLERLPKWALLWDNVIDGCLGDDSFRWWLRDSPTGDARDYLSKFIWMAIRNPFNYGKRFLLGADLRDFYKIDESGLDKSMLDEFKHSDDYISCSLTNLKEVYDIECIQGVSSYDVRDDFDHTGFQLLKLGPYYHLYWVKRWGNSNRAIVVEIGNKFGFRHRSACYPKDKKYKYIKGVTFEINPFKDIS